MPAIVLLQQPDVRPNLCVALRIQSSGLAEVQCEADSHTAAPLAERLTNAASRVQQGNARLGVFLERDPDPRLVRMYIVAAREDQALLSVDAIEDAPGVDADRSLALKVVDALRLSPTRDGGPVLVLQARESEPVSPARVAPRPWRVFLELGAGLRTGPAAQAVAQFVLGAARSYGAFRVEWGAGVDLGVRRIVRHEDGSSVRAREVGPLAAARTLYRFSRLEVGLEARSLFTLISADGTARDGSQGERQVLVPTLGLGLDVRMRLASFVALRVAPTLEVAWVEQRFFVDGAALLAYPPVRFALPVSFVFSLPLAPAERALAE